MNKIPSAPIHSIALPLALGLWMLLAGPWADSARAQPAASAPRTDRRPLSVGFLPEGSDFINAPILMERIRADLLKRPAVEAALMDAGFAAEIELSACDGPRDMVQRMNQNEFDLAFATAVVYARQKGDYAPPILTTIRQGDTRMALTRDVGVLRRGVVFAGPASPLFKIPNPTDAQKRRALADSPLAVPTSDSAAGYIYPTLTIHDKFGLNRPGQYWFCNNDAEVVKNVVAGFAQLGACREGELAALLPGAPEGEYFRVLFYTDLFPTDPIVLRDALSPERSALGVELKAALMDFFVNSPEAPPGLGLERVSEHPYDKLANDLQILDEINRRDGQIRSTPPAPVAPVASPTATPTATPTAAPTPRPTIPPVRPALPDNLLPATPYERSPR